MKITIQEVLKNQKQVADELESLIKQNRQSEALQIISDFGYLIRTENQAPLDEKTEFDNEAHELAVFLQETIDKIESHVDITDAEVSKVMRAVKKSVKETVRDIMETAKLRSSLSKYDAEEYKKQMQEGIEEARNELEKTQREHEFMTRVDEEIFGNPPLNIDIINKDNQIEALNDIAKKVEEIRKLQDNMALLNPDDPDEAKMIENHKKQIQELLSGSSGVEARLEALRDGGLDVGNLTDLIHNDVRNSEPITQEINSKKQELSKSVEADYAQIKENLESAAKKYAAYKPFSRIDFSKMDPTTEEGRRAIEAGYAPFKKVFLDLERRRNNAQNNIEVFEENIELLDKEKAILDKDTTDEKAYKEGMDEATKAKITTLKEEKHQDNRDKFYGNEEKAKAYREKFEKFKSHIVDAELSYVDRNGDTRIVHGKTLESYEGMEEDLEFMQLESYKERLERTSMYEATRDEYAYIPELAKQLEKATTTEERQAITNKIMQQMKTDRDYLATYHGAHNSTRMQYESYLTAGSALKSMVPLKSEQTLGGKIKVAAQNVGRYTGFKIPRFSRTDENGNKVSDVKSGIATMVGDGVIIGTAVAWPVALAIGYGAKTVGVVGLRAYGKHYGKKHKDEMDIPTPYDGMGKVRRAAREEKYLRDGHSRIGSWGRSWLDTVRKSHRQEVETEIIEARDVEIDKSIDDQFVQGAMATDRREQEKVRQNDQVRKSVHEQARRSGEVYDDMYGDVDSARKKTVDLRVSEATALGLAGEDVSNRSRIQFTDSSLPRSTNFTKSKLSVKGKIKRALKTGTQYGERVGETVWTHSIDNDTISRAITKSTDNKRRIITVLTGLALKGIGKAIQDTKTEAYTEQVGTGRYKREKVGSHEEGGDLIGYDTTTTTRDAGLDDLTVGDLQREGDASWGAFNGDSYSYASGYHPDVEFRASDDTIQGFALRFPDTTTGKTITYSVSGSDIDSIVHSNPDLSEFTTEYADGLLGITSDTKLSDLVEFIQDDSVKQAFEEYLSQYSTSDQVDKLLDAVEFAWGSSESVIGRGWTSSSLADELRQIVEETIDTNSPIYSDIITVDDYDLVEIMKDVTKYRDVVDPNLHALKGALEKAGLATSLQQLGEATAEVSQPTPEKTGVKLDTAEERHGEYLKGRQTKSSSSEERDER